MGGHGSSRPSGGRRPLHRRDRPPRSGLGDRGAGAAHGRVVAIADVDRDWLAHHLDTAPWAIDPLPVRGEGGMFVNRGNLSGTPGEDPRDRPLPRESFMLHDFDNRSRPERSGRIGAIESHMENFSQRVAARHRPIAAVEAGRRSVSTCHVGNIACRLGRRPTRDPDAGRFVSDSEADALAAAAARFRGAGMTLPATTPGRIRAVGPAVDGGPAAWIGPAHVARGTIRPGAARSAAGRLVAALAVTLVLDLLGCGWIPGDARRVARGDTGTAAGAQGGGPAAVADDTAAIVSRGFVFADGAAAASCHAGTLVETTPGRLVTAWFGGTREGAPDVGIWVARRTAAGWTAPVEVATGVQPDGTRHPCWNPVLFQPAPADLRLFYKVGPSPRAWWGLVLRSTDGGATWSDPQRLVAAGGIDPTLAGVPVGPIKNKPERLADGVILAPSSTEDDGWRVHVERSSDGGATWQVIGPLNDGRAIGAIQPSVLRLDAGRLLMIGRTRQGRLFRVESDDAGRSWGPLTLTDLPNPNSGTDAVTLADGRHVLVFNPVEKGRTPLAMAVSRDGRAWTEAAVLEREPGEYSYPAVIQAADGRVHVVYTWRRLRIAHVVLDPVRLP